MISDYPSNLYIGADGWNWDDWTGVFYPEGTRQSDYLVEYAKHYPTVEVDSTFYRIPPKDTVRKWDERTPKGFVFAAKVPRAITHFKFLEDCRDKLGFFLSVMDILAEKLGPLLFQFRYYRKSEVESVEAFMERLGSFLATLPEGYKFAVEIRNREWVTEKLLDLLREHRVAFTLADHPWMERPEKLMENFDIKTADFSYVRWLGDRKKIEKKTERWDKIVVDRRREMSEWIPAIRKLLGGDIQALYGFFSNRYAGYSPGSIELFKEMWESISRPA